MADWQQGQPFPPSDAVGGTISKYGDWFTKNGNKDQITALANRPGSPGKGFRHWRGSPAGNGGGGLSISLPSAVTEVWVRFYMRYQAGFRWGGGGNPAYTKEHYWDNLIFGHQGGAWGLHTMQGNFPSSINWSQSQNGNIGDGLFHCYEYHARQGVNGIAEVWVDNLPALSQITNMGIGMWRSFGLGNNDSGTDSTTVDYYTDYDDLAISTNGRIGPL